MRTLLRTWRRRAERGVSAIEYAVLAGLVAIVIISVVTATGGALSDVFGNIGGTIDKVQPGNDGGPGGQPTTDPTGEPTDGSGDGSGNGDGDGSGNPSPTPTPSDDSITWFSHKYIGPYEDGTGIYCGYEVTSIEAPDSSQKQIGWAAVIHYTFHQGSYCPPDTKASTLIGFALQACSNGRVSGAAQSEVSQGTVVIGPNWNGCDQGTYPESFFSEGADGTHTHVWNAWSVNLTVPYGVPPA